MVLIILTVSGTLILTNTSDTRVCNGKKAVCKKNNSLVPKLFWLGNPRWRRLSLEPLPSTAKPKDSGNEVDKIVFIGHGKRKNLNLIGQNTIRKP